MRAAILLPFALIALPALAEGPDGSRSGSVTVGPNGQAEIASAPCTALAGADYVPGVAADGSAVTPADLPQGRSPVTAEGTTVEIDQRLAGRFGVPASRAYRATGTVGTVTVRDGKAYFNGQPLAPDASAALAAACRAAH